ncbi:putative S-adenosyl-L-methionine-dependent methyltransferase [Thiomonas arsenitoxydans]|jgi:2-polyprenyl-3-methyl-5-hydroxy-6-metoxy-1,4-benzoquinol methylase|uniref:S-adenosyl-L-methionine-dependent methyltransferase n=1 Tax=Thiomonas arsenitoxydans (strain DSM 22701 / CIP 110005 / 3As) TaxID=426114 RepID=D6CR63_THIA3|nr:class I SAM-dependent methyltransferase [Thiomonas arsenitoxydans]CQR43780.1 putative S-adenosyl-L-methionine-dependent methyltransferase [Thiomonas sp. CB3]CAZ87104.1 putative S-adenosyl-L-methionine-dependent methyltransferase [Thiomonas arsenitoxydans]CQR27577.1 putative S-adenosyl-L-methionine-dependent methyltransferase [Thiomonas arsenitoxydans]CQR29675.1 putative S-adenosyl-L-methionine-dependent methyltransferase [Thiomonas arsenitoxydans]CQR39566.1 putative S-adenosyl-L-methionine-
MTDTPLWKLYEQCPLCGERGGGGSWPTLEADCSKHPLWKPQLPRTLVWAQCQKCQHVFTTHYWTESGLRVIFQSAHDFQLAGGDNDMKRQIWRPVIRNCISILSRIFVANTPTAKKWVDFGFGDGSLLMTAHDFGFDVLGIDARDIAVEKMRQFGFNCIPGMLDGNGISHITGASVVSLMDVLEHVIDPPRVLKMIREKISANTLLVISCPDLSASTWKIMDQQKVNPYWGEIEHHHNFSRNRLMQLLNTCGFHVVDFDVPYRYKSQMEMYALAQ